MARPGPGPGGARRSSEGVLEWEVSESELVGMEDRLEVEGNWLRMFPVSSLIWASVGVGREWERV